MAAASFATSALMLSVAMLLLTSQAKQLISSSDGYHTLQDTDSNNDNDNNNRDNVDEENNIIVSNTNNSIVSNYAINNSSVRNTNIRNSSLNARGNKSSIIDVINNNLISNNSIGDRVSNNGFVNNKASKDAISSSNVRQSPSNSRNSSSNMWGKSSDMTSSSRNDQQDLVEFDLPTWTPEWQPRHVHIAYGSNSSEVVVTWSSLTMSGIATVEWGTYIFALTNTSTGESRLFVDGGEKKLHQFIHRVHLTNLAPDTTYFYHVGGNFGWSAVFGFKTVPAGTEGWPLRLAFYGDMGVINAHSLTRLQQEAHQGMYDAVVHVGDMAYNMDSNNGETGDTFMDQIEPIAAYLPYMTCPGNHESAYDFSQYRNRFSMPNYRATESMYYSFELGPVHFIAINTELYYFGTNQIHRLQKQYDWLVNDLESATAPGARSERPWIIVFGHRPMYCTTTDHDDCTTPSAPTRVGMPGTHWFALEPLLARYGVDLAVWAHEHAYERLWPLYNFTVFNGTEQQPYTNPRAPVHITTGSAGCQEMLDRFLVKPEWSAIRVRDYGYTRITVINKTHLHLEQVSDDQDGALTDSVTLVRDRHESYAEHIPGLCTRASPCRTHTGPLNPRLTVQDTHRASEPAPHRAASRYAGRLYLERAEQHSYPSQTISDFLRLNYSIMSHAHKTKSCMQ